MNTHADWQKFLRDNEAVERAYHRLPALQPPRALDARVLEAARSGGADAGTRCGGGSTGVQSVKSQYLAPLALAATVLLSVAVVLAIAFGPQVRHGEDAPRVLPAAAHAAHRGAAPGLIQHRELFTSDPPAPREAPAGWLARIAALRKAGREAEADLQYRRFLQAYPGYAARATEW